MEPVSGFLSRHLRRRLIESEVRAGSKNPDVSRILDWVARVWAHVNKVLETHASSDVTLGPRLFLNCPLDVDSSRTWFIDLWNYSIVPYAINAVKEGLRVYGRKSSNAGHHHQGVNLGTSNGGMGNGGGGEVKNGRLWEDPTSWVVQSWPWPKAPQSDLSPSSLIKIRPEDVGYESLSHGYVHP
jgi:neuron navigator 2